MLILCVFFARSPVFLEILPDKIRDTFEYHVKMLVRCYIPDIYYSNNIV